MNKIRKLLIAASVCVCVCGVCACNVQQTAPTQTEETKQSDTVKTGIVLSASMDNLVIEAPDGTTYSFITDDTTEVVGEGENLGSTVSVDYAGEYKENTLAKKISIIKAAEESVSADASEVKPEDTPAAAPEAKSDALIKSDAAAPEVKNSAVIKQAASAPKYITGTVKDAAAHNITVEWGGREYLILKDDNTTVEGNVLVGSTVRVYHTGDIADGVTAIDISVVAPEITNSDIKYITGKVVDASMHTIVIENGGHSYSVKKDDNTKSDEVAVGDTVRVYHKGGLADGMTATSIIKQ